MSRGIAKTSPKLPSGHHNSRKEAQTRAITNQETQPTDTTPDSTTENSPGSTIIQMPARAPQYQRAEYTEYTQYPEYSAHPENAGNTSYPVFPGIELLYQDETLQDETLHRATATAAGNSSLMGIYHCREGKMECRFRQGSCHIAPGDLLIAPAAQVSPSCRFPSRHYRGISVLIDTDLTPPCLSCFLEDVTVQPRALAEKFCRGQIPFIVRGNPSILHIFSELYSVPPQIRKGYLKIKVLELLLFLSALDTGQDKARPMTNVQADLARQVCGYLTSHMEGHVTIEQLSDQFHVSGTYIRSCFKNVYGVSVHSFIRTRKMESAAHMLAHTDKSILEIAGAHGYDNGSKFAGAFRDVMGMSPREYRSLHCCAPSCASPCARLHRRA